MVRGVAALEGVVLLVRACLYWRGCGYIGKGCGSTNKGCGHACLHQEIVRGDSWNVEEFDRQHNGLMNFKGRGKTTLCWWCYELTRLDSVCSVKHSSRLRTCMYSASLMDPVRLLADIPDTAGLVGRHIQFTNLLASAYGRQSGEVWPGSWSRN